MKIFSCLRFLVFSCLALFANPPIAFGEDFYAGKTVRFVVGFSPGGGYDIYTRTIARHIGRLKRLGGGNRLVLHRSRWRRRFGKRANRATL